MPRKPREYSTSNVYHIIFRGNDKSDLFYDDQDRYVFLNYIRITKEKFKYDIYSYCLMNNHIHMVIKIKEDDFSVAMKSLAIRYSNYFNKKYDRTGHLFENKFLSKKVESLEYFIHVCKYVHRNPEKANISKTQDYKWSSFKEYKSKEDIVNKNVLLHYFNNDMEEFVNYTLNNDDINDLWNLADFEIIKKLNDDELVNIIKRKLDLKSATDISLLGKKEKDSILISLKSIKGSNLTQISRITKVNRRYISNIWENN